MAKATDTMDYAQHEKTFANFIHLVRFSMAALALGVVALYNFIITFNFWAGLFFLVLSVPVGLLAGGYVRLRK